MEKNDKNPIRLLFEPVNIAVIGAGSTYTPEMIEGFLRRRESLQVAELRLMDIDNCTVLFPRS